jgi:hypothetical protein
MEKMTPIQVAQKYLHQKEEPGNKFKDTPLGQLIHSAGQRDGEAWCAYFMEGVYCEAYPERNEELRKLFSASAVRTYENFEKAGFKVGRIPHPGDLVIWQRYVAGEKKWQGHAGIVTQVVNENRFKTIEGNTNSGGSREGDSVQEKERTLSVLSNGLNVLGFVTI